MGIASKLNTGRKQTVRKDISTKDISYLKPDELAKTNPPYPLPLAGYFLKDGKYGKQVTLIIDDGSDVYGVNVAKRYTDMFEGLTDEEIDEVKAGKLGIQSIICDVDTPNGKTTIIEFCDL